MRAPHHQLIKLRALFDPGIGLGAVPKSLPEVDEPECGVDEGVVECQMPS